jgi:peptide/nickel transport system permease protein
MTAVLSAPPSAAEPVRTDGGRWLVALTRLGRWLLIFVPVLLVSSFITFGLGALSSTNPAASVLGDNATPAAIARLTHQLGLDQPLLVQYWHWLSGALHGDLGVSYFTQIPVSTSIAQRLPVDVSLAVFAIVLAVVVGGAAGILAAVKQGSWIDRAVTGVCSLAATLPAFVIGIALVLVAAVAVHLFPSVGYVAPSVSPSLWLSHIVLPSVALSVEPGVQIARQLRTSMVDTLGQNFVTGAVTRGLGPGRVLFGHALRNAAGPAVTVLGLSIPLLIGGAVVTESVFALPGLGQLAVTSATERDIPVVQGVLLVTSVLVVLANLVVNAALVWLRPSAGRAAS